MKEVRTQQKYKCDYCKKRGVKHYMISHEKMCFRNPNRFCDYCNNEGFTMETILEGYGDTKVDCPYCSSFNKEMLKSIELREAKEKEIN